MSDPDWLTTLLSTRIYGRTRFDQPGSARQLLETICRHQPFVPDRYGRHEPINLPFGPDKLDSAITALLNQEANRDHPEDPSGQVLLQRRRRPRCLYNIEWSGMRLVPFGQSFYDVEAQYVHHPVQLSQWLEFNFALLALHDAWFAAFALRDEHEWKNKLVWTRPRSLLQRLAPARQVESYLGIRLEQNIPGVYWGNYFGPFYVEWLGRERFASLPCVTKRELPTGGIFFTTAPTPFDWQTPACRQLQRQVRQHLGADAFFDMEALRQQVHQHLGKEGITDPEQLIPQHRLPEFPFAAEYRARLAELEAQHREEIIQAQARLGMHLVGEPEAGVLRFEGKQGEQVTIDMKHRTLHYWPSR